MSIILSYLVDSFKSPLPWAYCKEIWENCTDAAISKDTKPDLNITSNFKSSAEFYFV